MSGEMLWTKKKKKKALGDFSSTVRRPTSTRRLEDTAHPHSNGLGAQSRYGHNPRVAPCGFPSHTHSHTTRSCAHPPSRALGISPTRHSAPRAHIYTLSNARLQHTQSSWTFRGAPVLIFSGGPSLSSSEPQLELAAMGFSRSRGGELCWRTL